MGPEQFVDAVAALAFKNVFNPYSDRCEVHDMDDAPTRRASALTAMLTEARSGDVDAIWIGRDLGYRGGRRTGLALTDDVHLQAHASRWGIALERPTRGPAVAERTAAVIWSVLVRVPVPIFLWNVFPLHPHEPADPFSNRSHSAAERRAGEDLLAALVELLCPRRLVAIGNDAAAAAHRIAGRIEVAQVRHPSYGGQADFLRQSGELYDLQEERGHITLPLFEVASVASE